METGWPLEYVRSLSFDDFSMVVARYNERAEEIKNHGNDEEEVYL